MAAEQQLATSLAEVEAARSSDTSQITQESGMDDHSSALLQKARSILRQSAVAESMSDDSSNDATGSELEEVRAALRIINAQAAEKKHQVSGASTK